MKTSRAAKASPSRDTRISICPGHGQALIRSGRAVRGRWCPSCLREKTETLAPRRGQT